MLPHSFHDLPKLRDSLSYLYFERGRITQTKLGIEYVCKEGQTLLPVATLTVLMLGPGTTITHAAVRTLTRVGCAIQWVGEGGVRCYAHGIGETHKAYKLARQAALVSDEAERLAVVRRMYEARFREAVSEEATLQQVRGKEGARVRAAYAEAADRYGVDWSGRHYDRHRWSGSDAPNRALSAANACLHGVVHAAIMTAGYSPGLGFIHQGKQLSFVYDIADLYKMQLTVPVAFASVAEAPKQLERTVRMRCRDVFRTIKLLERILPDIEAVLDTSGARPLPDGFDPDADPSLPTPWWTPGGDGAP